MAIVQNKIFNFLFNTPASTAAEEFKQWLDSFNCDYISTSIEGDTEDSTVTVTVNNKMYFAIRWYNPNLDGLRFHVTNQLYPVDEAATWTGSMASSSPKIIIVISNSSIFIFIDSGNTKCISYIYETIGAKDYYGYYWEDEDARRKRPKNIQNISMAEYGTSSFVYIHTTSLNYATTLGTIDYTTSSNLSGGGGIIISDPNFIGCSTVEAYQVYTFNSTNYYAVSSNILAYANNSLEV